MATLSIASKANQAKVLPAYLTVTYVNESNPNAKINIDIQDVDKLESGGELHYKDSSGNSISDSTSIIKILLEKNASLQTSQQSDANEWLERAQKLEVLDFKVIEPQLLELDSHLLLRSHIVGYCLSVCDLAVFGAIRGNRVALGPLKKGTLVNVSRWYKYIEEAYPWIMKAFQDLNAAANERKMAASKKGASYDIELKDTEKGVVTRFPPEPSGYLHIGHAKAALLNDYFAHEAYPGGKLICRFDDTNPSKEKEEFQEAIIKDLELMGIKPDVTSYSSDYFEEMYQYCIKMLKEGKAYADDTEQEAMGEERKNKLPSKRRDNSVEDNLKHFEEMKQGTDEGKRWCIRAKIKFDDNNGAMRDPVIYRCNDTPHHRTGSTWKIYPTYDFCVPILDALEGVTHALRTIEYRDRNVQYEWMQKAMGLRSVHIWDFARMNFIRTLLSKRKLTKLVDTGRVWGWDDPRFPTIRGIRRRGMTIGALREFILKQGPSRNIVNLDWTQFWATNKRFIDSAAPRHVAVAKEDMVTATVVGIDATHVEEKPLHPKNPDLGMKKVAYGPKIYLDQDDAQGFAQDEEITLMGWGNAYVRKIWHSFNPLKMALVTRLELELHLAGDVKTTKKKVTWLAADGLEPVPVELIDFDFLITKDKLEENDNVEDFMTEKTEFRTEALADAGVADLKKDDILQFERKGYYRVDNPAEKGKAAVLFMIPTGKEESMQSAKK